MKKSIFTSFLAIVLCFCMVACNVQTSDLVTALAAVSDAASVSVVVTSTLAGMGKLDPAIATQVATYAQEVTVAVNTSTTELASSDPNPVKITKISAAFAAASAPAFGKDAAPQVVAAVNAISSTISIFLSQLNSQPVKLAAKAAPAAQVKLSSGDKAMLKQINQKTAATSAAAAKLVVKK